MASPCQPLRRTHACSHCQPLRRKYACSHCHPLCHCHSLCKIYVRAAAVPNGPTYQVQSKGGQVHGCGDTDSVSGQPPHKLDLLGPKVQGMGGGARAGAATAAGAGWGPWHQDLARVPAAHKHTQDTRTKQVWARLLRGTAKGLSTLPGAVATVVTHATRTTSTKKPSVSGDDAMHTQAPNLGFPAWHRRMPRVGSPAGRSCLVMRREGSCVLALDRPTT